MNTEITYTGQGDYNLPNLKLPEQEPREIGVWGQRRRRYLREHHKILYYNLLTSCALIDHLADINEEATVMFDLSNSSQSKKVLQKSLKQKIKSSGFNV